MSREKIRVGSRESVLAVVQSRMVMDYLSGVCPDAEIELVTMKTTGDKILDRTLDKVGGKGLFVKELDHALRDGRADITVHSLKDMPMEIAEDIPLVAFSKREDPRDVLVLPEGVTELDLSKPIGSSSMRRCLQLQKLYPDAQIKPVRGNVQTRLKKLDSGEYSALVLAGAGLRRLGLENRISRVFTEDEIIPAAGQGIVAVEGRAGEDYSFLKGFDDPASRLAAACERAYVRELDGGCSSPIAAHAQIRDGEMFLRALYYQEETGAWTCGHARGSVETVEEAQKMGRELAEQLRRQGEGMQGKVWLVGAGPGDVGLLTLRGREVIARADVIVYDALVGQGVLALVPESAELINVGKRSGNHLMPQEKMNEVLLEKAQEGKRVVRLKGGDPFLFGRGGEELELLAKHGIPFEIVPGVTSAISVPGYNGIPVTHRDFTQSLHIITGHRRKGQEYDINFEALVQTKGTLVFLMGLASLPDIARGLMKAGMDPQMPSAVLQQGTTAGQRRVVAPLCDLEAETIRAGIQTPAIIVVGKVCALADQFHWYEDRPLAGKKILVTRPKELISKMAGKLRDAGAEVLEMPAIRTEAISPNEPLRACMENISRNGAYDWIVFTSPTGVRIFFEQLYEVGDVRMLGQAKVAAIGSGTAKELAARGLRADFLPSVYDGEHLGRELAEKLTGGEQILIPRAAMGNQELISELQKVSGVHVDDIATYETTYVTSSLIDEKAEIESGRIDYAVFTSASTVRGFAQAVEGVDFTRVKAVCIGRQTEAEAAKLGMITYVARKATMDSVVEKVIEVAGHEQ